MELDSSLGKEGMGVSAGEEVAACATEVMTKPNETKIRACHGFLATDVTDLAWGGDGNLVEHPKGFAASPEVCE